MILKCSFAAHGSHPSRVRRYSTRNLEPRSRRPAASSPGRRSGTIPTGAEQLPRSKGHQGSEMGPPEMPWAPV